MNCIARLCIAVSLISDQLHGQEKRSFLTEATTIAKAIVISVGYRIALDYLNGVKVNPEDLTAAQEQQHALQQHYVQVGQNMYLQKELLLETALIAAQNLKTQRASESSSNQ